jgi:adenine-specific DNA-methyltransferase
MSALVLRGLLIFFVEKSYEKSTDIHSENLTALNDLLLNKKLAGRIDLVYIDPPFSTGSVFSITNGRAATIRQ